MSNDARRIGHEMNEVNFHVCSWHCYRTVQQLCGVVQDNLFQTVLPTFEYLSSLKRRAVSSYSVPSTFKSNDYSIIRLLLANEVTHDIHTTDVMKLLVCNFEFEPIMGGGSPHSGKP